MAKTFRACDGRICERRVSAEDIRRERLYWFGVHAVALVGFLACVIAGGFI